MAGLVLLVIVGAIVGSSRAQSDQESDLIRKYGLVHANLSKGSESCRCIEDISAHFAETAPVLLNPPAESDECSGWSDGITCLPADYGLEGCKAYDDPVERSAVSRTCSRPDAPSWCKDKWCLVDGRTCMATRNGDHPLLDRKYNGRLIPLEAKLHYSYATCGSVDRFFIDKQMIAGDGMDLRVTAPFIEAPTVHFTAGQGSDWSGPAWETLQPMITELNITPIVIPLTVEAMENAPFYNPFWACVYMVTLNQTDLCVGDFWDTASRRQYMAPGATFTVSYALASQVMVTRVASDVRTGP